MNASLAEIVYRMGCRFRGTPVPAIRAQLEASQWWSEEEMRALRLERLRDLLEHARTHAPFYREHFRRHRFDTAVTKLEDLAALPSIGKREVARGAPEIQNRGRGGKLFFSKTAGTTSVPLSFHRSAAWDAGHRAAIARGCGWYGVEPWMRCGYLWAIPPGPRRRLAARVTDGLQNRFRQDRFDLAPETLERFYRRLSDARWLVGYSSMLYELARHVNAVHPGERRPGLLLVKGTSERIYPHYREEARKAFGQPVRGEYGAAETGIIAFECPEGNLHVNREHVIVETEHDEIVVTNLLSHSFPFIRYRLGDYVRLRNGFSCPCGRPGPVIDEIVGRVGVKVIGRGGAVFPSIAVDQILKSLALLGGVVAQCQAVQRAEGRLEFHVVPAAALGSVEKDRIERFFGESVPRYFGDAIDFEISYVDSIPRGGSKFLEFVSDLPPAGGDAAP